MAFSTIGKAPGVYIDEIQPASPIAGVATNIVGFVGITDAGPINQPTSVTSWDGFRQVFGEDPAPDSFLWYAVRGFFQNGGTRCFVVRASGSKHDELELMNRDGAASWTVSARSVGPQSPPITVEIKKRNALTSADTIGYKPEGQLKKATPGRDFQLKSTKEAARFRPGDRIEVDGQVFTVTRSAGDTLTVDKDPAPALAANKGVVLAATVAADKPKTIRIASTVAKPLDALVPGAILTVTQGATTNTGVVVSVFTENLDSTDTTKVTYRVTFRDPLTGSYDFKPTAAAIEVTSETFDIVVQQGSATPVTYEDLSLDVSHRRYFLSAVNGDKSGLVQIEWKKPRPGTALPNRLPAVIGATALAGGILNPPSAADFKTAIDKLEKVDLVSLLACPDAAIFAMDPGDSAGGDILKDLQGYLVSHCENLGDRFAVLDSRAEAPLQGDGSVDLQRDGLNSDRGYGALYYPWLRVPSAVPNDFIWVPPSGHVCGVISRSDGTRGVHKAPANESLRDTLAVQMDMSDTEQGALNEKGVNCIRSFGGGVPILWGARTISASTAWRYVSTRRLFLYLEESIQEGIRWAVFEPNNQTLWRKLRRTITDFLMRAFRDGAFFGDKPEQAFYVRIDEVLNPFSEMQLGRLTIEIGIKPAYPAEFIVVRIGIWPGGTETIES